MSDYCTDCHYKVKEKVGERACPFNSLYWHFMEKHRARVAINPRLVWCIEIGTIKVNQTVMRF